MKKKYTNSKKTNKKVRKIFLILLLSILIFMSIIGLKILKGIHEYSSGNDAYSEIQDIAIKQVSDEKSNNRIDFDSLKQVNADVIGWLTLNDTVIDYPVVKGNDNDYYLNHLLTGEINSLGTLFVDYRNNDPFMDQLTVIYGHSMLNGSMFFILERYKNQSFYEEHQEFVFETPDQTYIFEPIAGKVMDAKIPFLQFNFNTEEEYLNYINEYISTSTFRSYVDFEKTDKTVMLIKCSADYEDARYVLLCKVKRVEKEIN